ncbi:TniQ family protein [Mycolicibacterium porcinum]|uniref:TniQ family protein n=1 Tax=Mycolicibacterium porcinum TaxID=39693 RepID=UPI001193D2AC|nr:TniQ family protein [Mycolicibacterium porcinum]
MSTELFGPAPNYDRTGVPALRTLPLRLAPLTGESLDSWLEALAAHSDTPWADLLAAVGYAHTDPATASRHPPLTASPLQLTSLNYTTGTSPEDLRSMTLAPLMAVTGCHSDVQTLTLPRSRFCPQCLIDSGGRWQLWWRLRWAFVCPFHHCLLADACPRCRRQQRVITPPGDFVPTPGMCALRALNTRAGGRTPRRCGAPPAQYAQHSARQ